MNSRRWRAGALALVLGLLPLPALADSVNVFCKVGTAPRGKLLALTDEAVVIDPDGPVSYRRFSLSEVDSVVVGGMQACESIPRRRVLSSTA